MIDQIAIKLCLIIAALLVMHLSKALAVNILFSTFMIGILISPKHKAAFSQALALTTVSCPASR